MVNYMSIKLLSKKHEVVILAHNPTGEVSIVQVYISPSTLCWVWSWVQGKI